MKNKISDVRNHLVAMMELLGSDECDAQAIERAKAVSQLVSAYVGTVKVEIDAMRLADDIGRAPSSIDIAAPAKVLPFKQGAA